MNRQMFRSIVTTAVAVGIWVPAQAREAQLAHMVFFQLKEGTDDAQEKLVAACNKYLSGHPGTVYYSAGIVAQEMDRDVNVRDFDVSLHVVFANKAAHDTYQTHPRHLKFIAQNKSSWESVRVFDSRVFPVRPARDDRPDRSDRRADRPDRRIALPDPAAYFAGMIRGKVLAKRDDGQLVLRVQQVTQVWKTNRAEKAQALIGKRVLVNGRKVDGKPEKPIQRFLASLQLGETVEIDVAHREGEALTIVELTQEQREKGE